MRHKSPLSKIRRPPSLSRRFKIRSQGRLAALDVDGQMLRVAQTATRGLRTVVNRLAAVPLEWPSEADRSAPAVMGKVIARALDQVRGRPNQVVMGVPRALVILRTLSLPVIDDIRELASMVHFQVGRDLPFRMEEAVIDFKVRRQIEGQPGGETPEPADEAGAAAETVAAPMAPKLEVLVAAVRREVVQFYEETATAAGFRLAALGLLSHANARCLEACEVAEGEEAVALVSLRPDEVGIDVVAQQSLLFSRGAAIRLRGDPANAPAPVASGLFPELLPPSPFTDEETEPVTVEQPVAGRPQQPSSENQDFVNSVTIEVVRSMHSYGGMEPQHPVAKVVVVGATGHEPAVVDALQSRLSMPCTWLDLAGTIELPKAARGQAAGSISAIGLALGAGDPQGLPFDFLNPKRPAVRRNLRRIRLVMGGALAAAAALFLAVTTTHLKGQRTKILREVQAELSEAKKRLPLYRQMRQHTANIQNWVEGGQNWLEHYAFLTAILPPCEDIYVTSFSVSLQGRITLSVQARSGEILAKLDKHLRTAGYEVKPSAVQPGNDKFGYDFRSSVELRVPDGIKIDLAKVRPPDRPSDDASLDRGRTRGGGG